MEIIKFCFHTFFVLTKRTKKELFLEAAGVLMEKREEVIGDCRAVMEALADCGSIDTEMEAVSSEMEVTAGLIQKLVDENATRKLDQHDYRKKYDGYASRYSPLEILALRKSEVAKVAHSRLIHEVAIFPLFQINPRLRSRNNRITLEEGSHRSAEIHPCSTC